MNAAIASVKGLTETIRSGDNIKEYLREEKGYIKDQLERFGLTKELKKINKNLYYYSEELMTERDRDVGENDVKTASHLIFHPLEVIPRPYAWFKENKFFWRNETDWRSYMAEIKK